MNKNIDIASKYNDIFKYVKEHTGDSVYKKEEINNIDSLDFIKNKKYMVSHDITALPVWIVFFILDSCCYSVVIGKYGKHPIFKIDVSALVSIYDGTILDGYYIDGNIHEIMINDIFYLEGHNTKNFIFEKRREIIDNILYKNIKIKKSPYSIIKVLSVYNANNEKQLLELFEHTMTINNSKNKYKIENWLFFPNQPYSKKQTSFYYKLKSTDLTRIPVIIKEVIMRKTKSPDVYYIMDKTSYDRLGIASVPTSELSKKFKDWFPKDIIEINIECKYDVRENKWNPIVPL